MAEIFSGILKEFFKINYLENDFSPVSRSKKCQTKKNPKHLKQFWGKVTDHSNDVKEEKTLWNSVISWVKKYPVTAHPIIDVNSIHHRHTVCPNGYPTNMSS